jgi:adenylate kinase
MSIFPLFVGPPGCGKGTQAEFLSSLFLIPRVSGGDLLRRAAASSGAFAARIRAYLDAGRIIEDPFVMHMIDQRLDEADCKRGAILDGCVRTLGQAVTLDRLMARRGGITLVVSLRIPDDIAASRIASRWTHRITGAPLSPGRQQEMAAALNDENHDFYRRPEDEPALVRKRQELYRKLTVPAVEYYRRLPSFLELDGTQQAHVLHQDIVRALRLRSDQLPA